MVKYELIEAVIKEGEQADIPKIEFLLQAMRKTTPIDNPDRRFGFEWHITYLKKVAK